MSPRDRRRLFRLVGLAAALAALLSGAYLLGFQRTWQAVASDFLYSRQPETSSRVAIVTLDVQSHRELVGDRPVATRPRDLYAGLVDQLAAAGARVIALDVLFEVEQPDDAVLGEAIARAGNVVVATVGELDDRRLPAQRPAPIGWMRLDRSVSPVAASAAAEAHAMVTPDPDSMVRRIPLVVESEGRDVAALALVGVARYLRRPAPLDGSLLDGHLPLAGRLIPVDDLYQVMVNYVGGPARRGRSAFPTVSMRDVLQGTADSAVLRDRLVFVGPWSVQERDDRDTPLGTMYGVEIHANTAEMLLRGTFLVPANDAVTVASVWLLALAPALLLWRLRPLWAGLAAMALVVGYVAVASGAFEQGVMLNMLYPLAALLLSFVALNGYQLVFEQAEQRALRRVLSRYLSPAVAAAVAREPDRIDLGGELREMTVLFSDIRGFTTLSERTPPRELVALLNEYMTAMVDILFEQGGTLDKYMGDAIMAFWNAPQTQADHAARACRTALAMAAGLERLRRGWLARGMPPLEIGIGLNTGPMVFGNMGSELRTDFTVLGDSVNLASRLEGLNKEYGTSILVGDGTRAAVGDEFAFRFLDLVAVKGRREPVAVYELLAVAGALDPARVGALAAYERGIAAYRARDWAAASAAFGGVLRMDPADGPSAVYLARIEEYASVPPPAEWDGVYVATHK